VIKCLKNEKFLKHTIWHPSIHFSIMTGLYPLRIGITTPAFHVNKLVLEKQLAAEESEALDLAFSEPTRVKKLTKRMDELLEKTEGLIPIPNPDYNSHISLPVFDLE